LETAFLGAIEIVETPETIKRFGGVRGGLRAALSNPQKTKSLEQDSQKQNVYV